MVETTSLTLPQCAVSQSEGAVRILSAAEAGITNSDICSFYAENWERPIALSRDDFSHWQFNASPAMFGQNCSIVALEGDRIIAVMGVTPAAFLVNGRRQAGAELTTWVVAPAARGKRVGHKILTALQDRYNVLTGAGITAAAVPLYLKAGFAFLAHIPRFFHIGDFETVQRFASASPRALKLTVDRQSAALQLKWHATAVSAADLAAQAAALSSVGHFARDAERLSWRYDQHPVYKYEAFCIKDAHQSGTGAGVILRPDRVENTPILHVIDIFGDPDDLSAALAFVEREARRRGAAFVDVSLTSGTICARIRARGWSSAIDDPLVELPSLFYPVELRRPATTSMAIWAREGREGLFDFSRLHITRGDMDLDRPTLDWYERNTF
jgi:GNAT superfamily N-acetyltransferase